MTFGRLSAEMQYICISFLICSNMNALPDKTYFETHATDLLLNAGLSKARFAEKMGIARQNILKLFETKNVFTLIKASEILNVPLVTLIYGDTNPQTSIDGFVEINGAIHRIKDKKDIEELLNII